jgi:starch phosphorylase
MDILFSGCERMVGRKNITGKRFRRSCRFSLFEMLTTPPLQIEVSIRERNVLAQVWRADVGHVPLYLLDTNIPENVETDRWVTGHLYGGDRETRIVQEMLLGIGGIRLLRRLNITPHVFHLNEGHSAFLTLELAREVIQKEKKTIVEASESVRAQCVFTTHTTRGGW